MNTGKDLVGMKFTRLEVIKKGDKFKNGNQWWCKCDCGNPELVLIGEKQLLNGRTKSCGCLRRENMMKINHNKLIDLTDRHIGRLTVIKRGENIDNNTQWWCKCDCGNPDLILVRGSSLLAESTRSCGCLRKETARMNRLKHTKKIC